MCVDEARTEVVSQGSGATGSIAMQLQVEVVEQEDSREDCVQMTSHSLLHVWPGEYFFQNGFLLIALQDTKAAAVLSTHGEHLKARKGPLHISHS